MLLNSDGSCSLLDIPRRADAAYAVIREAIVSGRIAPGERLRQEAWAEYLSVSQVTVREAFSRLRAEGLLIQEPFRGVRALALPADEQEDVLQMRAHLEGLAMEIAAPRITEEDLARMRALLPGTVLDERPESVGEAWKANREFHWIAIRASGRRHLERVLGQIWDLTNHYHLLSQINAQERVAIAQHDLREHKQLLQMLEAHDGPGARRVIMEATYRALQMVQTVIGEQGERRPQPGVSETGKP